MSVDAELSVAKLRAGEVARAAGVNRETLRYYERRGLLAQPVRSLGGHRLYPPETVTAIRLIKAAQRLGFTLAEVGDLLRFAQRRHVRTPDTGLQSHARTKLAEVEARIEDLSAIRATLLSALDAGCDDLDACAMTEGCPLPLADPTTDGPS